MPFQVTLDHLPAVTTIKCTFGQVHGRTFAGRRRINCFLSTLSVNGCLFTGLAGRNTGRSTNEKSASSPGRLPSFSKTLESVRPAKPV